MDDKPSLKVAKQHAFLLFDGLDVSLTTREDYKARIALFLTFLLQHNGFTFTSDTFLHFKRMLQNRNDYSVSTKNKYLITARVFLKELNRKGVIPTDITQNVKVFAQTRKHKKEGLNQDEITRLIDHVHKLPLTAHNIRLKAILCLLSLQGLRQVEITRLDVKDIDLVNSTALVQGKGRDDKEPIKFAS